MVGYQEGIESVELLVLLAASRCLGAECDESQRVRGDIVGRLYDGRDLGICGRRFCGASALNTSW